ncbi:MAG: vitamin K epoxide reductase family protein [candidate division NC10 bacterium]|nr:vitamin K epoxide reductase family protein [candidate division NC10 bacterium]
MKPGRALIGGMILFSLFGLGDSAYLTWKHVQEASPFCPRGGCNLVLSSHYAEVWGIPLSLIGALGYGIILALSLWAYLAEEPEVRKALSLALVFSIIGFLVSLVLVYLQLFVLKSICIFCIASALTMTTIFLLTLFSLRALPRKVSAETVKV